MAAMKPEPVMTEQDKQEARERLSCPACQERRVHTEEEWKRHPGRGKGVSKT